MCSGLIVGRSILEIAGRNIVRRLGPVFFGNINFRGTMSFSIEKYAAILLSTVKSSPTGAATHRVA